jgi:hypothetical protein
LHIAFMLIFVNHPMGQLCGGSHSFSQQMTYAWSMVLLTPTPLSRVTVVVILQHDHNFFITASPTFKPSDGLPYPNANYSGRLL